MQLKIDPMKKKVLFVTPYSSAKGLKETTSSGCGAEESLLILLQNLNRDKYLPFVIYPLESFFREQTQNVDVRGKLEKMGIEYCFLPMGALKRNYNPFIIIRILWRTLILAFKLSRLIKRERIDLVHTNSSQVLASGIAARLCGVPSVYHIRQLIARPKVFRQILAKIMDVLADKIIGISTAVCEMFWENGVSRQKCTTIFNGVDLKRYPLDLNPELIKKELHLDPQTVLVGLVGRMSSRKGHIYFLEAARLILSKFSAVKFLIVGDIDSQKFQGYKNKLFRLTKDLGLNEKVIFLGFRSDIPEIMAALDVLILPSCSEKSPEPLGRVLIEAMAADTPVVATKDGGVVDIVVDGLTGILVPPRNSQAIAEAVLYLLYNPSKAEEMGKAGRRRVEELFTAREYVQKMEEVFEEFI